MSHRSTGFTRKQRISAAVLAVALMLTMALPAVAAPSGPTSRCLSSTTLMLAQGPL